eukprot:994965-Alexandrium_andersonii.AAC.1
MARKCGDLGRGGFGGLRVGVCVLAGVVLGIGERVALAGTGLGVHGCGAWAAILRGVALCSFP